MLCLTCGYSLGSAQESEKDESHEGRVGRSSGSERGPCDLATNSKNGGREAAKSQLRPVPHRDHARAYRAAQKAVASLLFAGSLFAAEPSLQSRTVQVEKQDFVQIYSTYNYSTIVVLPEKEEIKDVTAGERTFWMINWTDHTVSVKPRLLVRQVHKRLESANINIEAASGNVYSVVVSEVSGTEQPADLKVVLEQKNPEALANIQHPAFIRSDLAARENDELKKSLSQKTEELAQVKRTASVQTIQNENCDYTWKHGKESGRFGLKSICDDGKKMYIKAHSQHAPVLYESRDGKDSSIVNYTLENGLYVADHIIDVGELRAGKTKLKFQREKESI